MITSVLSLSLVIQIHAAAAIAALVIGPFVLWWKRRDRWHKLAGKLWITLMLIVATSAWFIHGIRLFGPFSPIHLFSLLVYRSLFLAIRHVRAGRFEAHGAEMRSLYFQALAITAVLTLLPGRAMQRIFFGDAILLSLVAMTLLGLGLLFLVFRKPKLMVQR